MHSLLKNDIYSDLKQQLLSTTSRDDTQRALINEISSTMRRLDESMRRHQELIARMHEITNRSFSLPMREDPVTLLIADLIDDFDGSH